MSYVPRMFSPTRRKLLLLGGIALSGCSPSGTTSCNVRMKHTFHVDDVQKIVTSVMRVQWYEPSGFSSGIGSQFVTKVDAQAAVADFGPLGLVFLPLRSDRELNRYPITVLLEELVDFWKLTNEERPSAIARIPDSKTEVEVMPIDWPMLVAFSDIAQPDSAFQLRPTDLFPESGQRISLHRSTLQVTTDPVSTGIEAYLPWLNSLEGTLGGSKIIRPRGPVTDRLTRRDF